MRNVNFKAIVAVLLLLAMAVGLVACQGEHTHNFVNGKCECGETESQPTDPAFDAATVVAGYADKVSGTVKLTYVTNYQVDVVREGADASGMASFKRDVVASVVIEMDLGEDLYIKVTKTRQDKLVETSATTTEEILYKKDGKYYYQSSSSNAVEVADAAAKLAEIFEATTYEQIGGLTLDALVYNSLDKSYELKLFGLSDTFIEEDLVAPVYSAGQNGGLKVNYKPEYIGYKTDGGWSDFSNSGAGYAAEVEINTNDKGYVTSMKETYNSASLVFNIMTPPPTVTVTGERSFTATYGEAITKEEGVAQSASKAVYTQSNGGSFVVKTCAMGDFGNMTEVANGGALEMGKFICVKPTANEGYEIDKVVVNGSDTTLVNPASAGGFYCFYVAPGDNTIVVTFKETAPAPSANGVVTVDNKAGCEYQVQSFVYAGAPTDYKVITNGEIVPGAAVYGAIVIDSSKEVTVTVNGEETVINIPNGGTTFYCFAVPAGGQYQVVITGNGPAPTNGVVNVTNKNNVSYQLQSFVYAGAPTDYKVITNGEIVPGAAVYGAIVVDSSKDVTVTVNGTETVINIPNGGTTFYCFAVTEAGNYEVVITENGASASTNGIVTVTNNSNISYQLQSFTYAGAPTDYKVITNGEIVPGAAVYGAIVVDSSKDVTVTVNGAETVINIPNGGTTFYCFAVTEAGNYEVVITENGASASTNGVVKVTNNTKYTYQLQSFTYAGAPTDYKVITNGEIVPGAAIYGAIVLSSDANVTVVVNGTETVINIPNGGVTFYCFAVNQAGEYNVVINSAN